MRRAIWLWTLMSGLVAPAVLAADWRPLSGTFAITAKEYLDPADGDKPDSHLRIQLDGEAARALYDAMPGPPAVDACTGGLSKVSGEMVCTKTDGDRPYACHFAIEIATQKVVHGVAC